MYVYMYGYMYGCVYIYVYVNNFFHHNPMALNVDVECLEHVSRPYVERLMRSKAVSIAVFFLCLFIHTMLAVPCHRRTTHGATDSSKHVR